MSLHLVVSLVLSFPFSYTYENVRMTPRITQPNPGCFSIPLPSEQPNAVFYMDTSDSLYIGGEEVLYHYENKTLKTYPIKKEENNCKVQEYCKNFVTLITRLNGNLFVCGTNAYNPACWKMDGGNFTRNTSPWAVQLSPPKPGLNYNILNTGTEFGSQDLVILPRGPRRRKLPLNTRNEMYTTIPKQSNNAASLKVTTFRKINGKEPMSFTSGNLLKNPVFVKSLELEGEPKTESRIFLFFMDDNSERRTTDRRVSMIARMCKEEMGSDRPDGRNMFSTALKSRLICGTPDRQYYNFLQDIYFLQSQSLVYGLFINAWNHSAVCSYKIEDIELVFNSSDLFESSRKDLKSRPGKCLLRRTPQETADEVFSHPELVDWVWPSGNQTVFQTAGYYRKLVVDEITAVNEKKYRVVILATDNGTLHKVVELEDGALNVLEIQPFNKTGKILYLELDQNHAKHFLYVGTAYEFSGHPLDDCREYNKSCTDCIASRDPYCGWFNGQCQSILIDRTEIKVFQNLTQGAMCEESPKIGYRRGHHSISSNKTNTLPPSIYHLKCPAESKQASYYWIYGDNHTEICTPRNGNCDLFFHSIEGPGEYKCVEVEYSRQRCVFEYKFQRKVENSSLRLESGWILMTISVFIMLYIHMTPLSNS